MLIPGNGRALEQLRGGTLSCDDDDRAEVLRTPARISDSEHGGRHPPHPAAGHRPAGCQPRALPARAEPGAAEKYCAQCRGVQAR